MKQQLKNQIQLLRISDQHKDIDFENFWEVTNKIVELFDCKLRYLRVDSHRNGHAKVVINRETGEKKYELAINKNDNIAGKVYTIIHELTHIINNHMLSRYVTRKQAEVVADTCAYYFLSRYNLLELFSQSNVASKWDVSEYANKYIDSMGLSKISYQRIIGQINNSKVEVLNLFLKMGLIETIIQEN